jgi:hypothetical protein
MRNGVDGDNAIARTVERECIAPQAVSKKLAVREGWIDDARGGQAQSNVAQGAQ